MGPQQTRWHPKETAGREPAGGVGLERPHSLGGRPGEHGGAVSRGSGSAARAVVGKCIITANCLTKTV